MIRRRSLLLAAPAVIAASRARAADAVKVGVLMPLTGNSAGAGAEMVERRNGTYTVAVVP